MTRTAWWLCAATACIVLPLASVAVATFVVDPETFKGPLIRAVSDATGRILSLDGPLQIRWSLWPSLQVNGVRLANVAGGSRQDMARAERIEAKISLLALLRRRLEILQLTLTGPNILFESVDGRSNWIFDAPSQSAEAGSQSEGSAFQLRIRDVRVINGMVTVRLPARTHVIGLRSVNVRHATDGSPLELSGVFVYGDNQPFALQGSAVPTAGLHGPWTTRLAFKAFDTTATGTGTMTLAGDYDLQVEVRSGTLDRLNALLPEMQLPAVQGVSLSAHVTSGPVLGSLPVVGPATLAFDDANLQPLVPGLQLGKAAISLAAAGGQAAISGQGSASGLAFAIKGSAEVPRNLDGPATLPFNLAWTAGANRMAAKGRLTVSAMHLTSLDTHLSVQAPTVPLSMLADQAGLPGPISGTARVVAELHAAGTTPRRLAASLDGPLSVTATGGRIGNQAFLKLMGRALGTLGIAVPAQGSTELRCLGLVGTFANGVLRLRTIALNSTYLALDGTGQIDLGHESVALKLHPLVQVGGSPVAVPVIVEGPFRSIKGHLDATGLDKLGLFIDGLFGGDKPDTCSDAGLVPAAGR